MIETGQSKTEAPHWSQFPLSGPGASGWHFHKSRLILYSEQDAEDNKIGVDTHPRKEAFGNRRCHTQSHRLCPGHGRHCHGLCFSDSHGMALGCDAAEVAQEALRFEPVHAPGRLRRLQHPLSQFEDGYRTLRIPEGTISGRRIVFCARIVLMGRHK